MNEQQWIDLARAWLTMDVDPGSRLDDNGVEAETLALAFGIGIEIEANGETWRPSPKHLYPGTANFKLAAEALERDALTFIGDPAALIDRARGDKAAHDACEVIFHTMAQMSQPIPPRLARWAVDAKRPRKGAHKFKPRNRAILRAVDALVAEGLKPTRNDASAAVSACDYVAQAAGVPYDSVKGIWIKTRPWEKLAP